MLLQYKVIPFEKRVKTITIFQNIKEISEVLNIEFY